MYYVYILYSRRLKKRYFGSTTDLKTRLAEHNRGKVGFTRGGIPWLMIYYSAFALKTDANREERFFKSSQGREKLKFLLKDIMEKLGPAS